MYNSWQELSTKRVINRHYDQPVHIGTLSLSLIILDRFKNVQIPRCGYTIPKDRAKELLCLYGTSPASLE